MNYFNSEWLSSPEFQEASHGPLCTMTASDIIVGLSTPRKPSPAYEDILEWALPLAFEVCPEAMPLAMAEAKVMDGYVYLGCERAKIINYAQLASEAFKNREISSNEYQSRLMDAFETPYKMEFIEEVDLFEDPYMFGLSVAEEMQGIEPTVADHRGLDQYDQIWYECNPLACTAIQVQGDWLTAKLPGHNLEMYDSVILQGLAFYDCKECPKELMEYRSGLYEVKAVNGEWVEITIEPLEMTPIGHTATAAIPKKLNKTKNVDFRATSYDG